MVVRGGGPSSFHFDLDSSSSSRILPPGAWWKDQELARRIDLTPDQQQRIADFFLQNKIQLIHMHASLEEEELLLEPLLNANPPDQGKALAQISKIADTRADLEKANAKMLLSIRGVLNQQQWTKLQQERPGNIRLDLHGPFGPRSFEFNMPEMPDTHALMEQMRQDMPDMQKLRQHIQASMPDMAAIREQLGAAELQMRSPEMQQLRDHLNDPREQRLEPEVEPTKPEPPALAPENPASTAPNAQP